MEYAQTNSKQISEISYRNGHSVSYAVSVENISIQVNAIMNNGWAARNTGPPATAENVEDQNVDQVELSVSMGLGENGKIAFAHKNHDSKEDVSKKSNFIAGEYSIGGITAYLGYAQHKPRMMKG